MFRKQRKAALKISKSNDDSGGSTTQRVVDCAKVLLDVAKESADWFPPLKSVLGGVNALIIHYEQFADVKEKIQELVPLLDRFKQCIVTATVDGDPEETDRRKRLTSAFKHVEETSQQLLAKGVIARFADKGKDAKVVAGLIERLREAIASYQISQQQAIYHRIHHLTLSIDTFLKLQEEPPLVKEKLESIMARLERLNGFPWQELPHERQTKLFDDLKPVRDKIQTLHERIMTEGYLKNKGDVSAASALAEDFRDILLEYWMMQQQSVYDQNCRLIDAADLLVLNNCRRAQRAEYRHGNRRGCLRGTRSTVLNKIESWAKNLNDSPIFWLNGLAGTGKSAIAQTIAEHLFADESLGASFFCSRDFEDRSDLQLIFPTLAFQLAHKYPGFRSHLVSLLKSNPDVVHESLHSQMEKLIVEPLVKTGVSTVIVVDALDECKDDEPSSAFLSVLGRFVGQIDRVKFFITGRPEPRIKTGFRLPLLADETDIFVLHDVHPSLVDDDIRLFFKHELSEVARQRQLEGWPSDEHISLLCGRAAGLFVYAVATVKFLNSGLHLPKKQLDVLVKLPESTAPEGMTRFSPKTSLDSLYSSILRAAFSEGDAEVDSKVRATIGTIVLVVNPLPPPAIAELLALDPEEVILFLKLIQSLLVIDEDVDKPVKPFHKSFPDFITDPSRCADPRFYISPGHLHLELVTNCLGVMNDGLERNLLSLPEYALNSEVKDLSTRINGRVSAALQYACQSWHNHLTKTGEDFTDVIDHLRTFLEHKFLAWLEVVSALGAVNGAIVALERLIPWLQEVAQDNELLDTARDFFHFLTQFFEPINASAAHVYHSALEQCPTSSIVRKLYYDRYDRITRLPRVVVGTPDSWDFTTSFAFRDYHHRGFTWSPCGRFIAAWNQKVVTIWDQLTLEVLTTLRPTTETAFWCADLLAYSPDGRCIACTSYIGYSGCDAIIVWDVQTGGVVKEMECRINPFSLVWSLDGSKIGVVGSDSDVYTYEVVSGTRLSLGKLYSGTKETRLLRGWAHEESFRAVVMTWGQGDRMAVDVFEVGSTLIKLHSVTLFVDPAQKPNTIKSFSPSTFRISVWTGGELCVFGDKGSSCLLRKECGDFNNNKCCFSSDGNLFAASIEIGEVLFWKYTCNPDRYILWRKFQSRSWIGSDLQFSPNLSSVMGSTSSLLLVCRLHDLPTPSTDPPCDHPKQYTSLTRAGNRIATAYKSEGTITILDVHSRTPLQFIDTGMDILKMGIFGDVLLVASAERTVAWLLTKEGLVKGVVENRRADYSDRIWGVRGNHSSVWVSNDTRGKVVVLRHDMWLENFKGIESFAFHGETGELLLGERKLNHRLAHGGHERHLHYSNFNFRNPNRNHQTSQPKLRQGWVEDSKGRCMIWIPGKWQSHHDSDSWDHNTSSMRLSSEKYPIIIKF